MNYPRKMTENSAHVIVFGNEKGGSGKSTAAMHTTIALLRLGYRVGSIDLDARQGTLTRYLKNRFLAVMHENKTLPAPAHMAIERSTALTVMQQKEHEFEFLTMALDELCSISDFVIIDTPGADTHLNRMAHAKAHTLITPLNDSYIDLDVLVDLDPQTHAIRGPSVYAKMVMDQRKHLPLPFRWLIMRNRVNYENKSCVDIDSILENLTYELDFSLCPGFSERALFKDMFLQGLTLLDVADRGGLSIGHISARQEVRGLIRAIGPEKIKGYPILKSQKKF